ncbi:hypothetical protein BGZ74_006597, partial [Mortierella antarctica]
MLNNLDSAFSTHTFAFLLNNTAITTRIPNKNEFLLTALSIVYSIDVIVATLGTTPFIHKYPARYPVSTIFLIHINKPAQGVSYYLNVGSTGTKSLPPIPQAPVQRQLLGTAATYKEP